MVYNIGINDMPRGWKRRTEWNLRVYTLWHSMLCRCYDEKYHQRFPTYKECYVCERWLMLSNFVEDIVDIENYELWLNNSNQRIALDKDIKSNGNNKCYCLEQCMFVTVKENNIQLVKTRDNRRYKGKNNPNAKSVKQYDLDGNLIKEWDCIQQPCHELGIKSSNVSRCIYGKQKTAKGIIWKR